jgi:hypothetical protein
MKRAGQRHLMGVVACMLFASGCGERLDLGSDLLWTARFEDDSLAEWSSVTGGGTFIMPGSNTVEPTAERVRNGKHAAKITVTARSDGGQATAQLERNGNLPDQAFYSAWYYLPQGATVAGYWVLMKLRIRTQVSDPSSDVELFDIDLQSLPSGEMALAIYDHSQGGRLTLGPSEYVVPTGVWFQIEVFYRNANDATGRLTVWLDGREVADVAKPTGPPGWAAWNVGSVVEQITPQTVIVYVDDCAISRTQVGPAGLLSM